MFSERLKAERERLGLSQTAFGELCGVRKQAQINYEKGERSPDTDYLQKAQSAGVDASYLLTGMRSTLTLSSEEQVLVDKYRLASPETKNQILLLLLGGSASVQGIHNSPNSSISNSFNG